MAERQDRNNTEQVVYEAAVDLMSLRGYHGTSLRDVAKAVGVQMSSLYYYFPSKQEMLMAIMRRTMRDMHAYVEPAIRAAATPREQLEAGIRAHVLFHADRRKETLVTDSEIRALEPENREEIVDLRDRYGTMFREVLEEGKEQGTFAFGDSHVATNALMTMCAGVASWYDPHGPMSLPGIAEEFVAVFIEGIAAGSTQPV